MNTDNLQLEYVVLKLVNGEEIICKAPKNFVSHYKDFYDPTGSVTIYSPLKATVEQYYERDDDNSAKVAVFERTIMTSWVRFSYLKEVDLPYTQILLAGKPIETIIEKYDDLCLKYDTYASNPDLADSLYGTPDVSDFYDDELEDKELGEEIDDDEEYDDEEYD